jgi:hypothetical protein
MTPEQWFFFVILPFLVGVVGVVYGQYHIRQQRNKVLEEMEEAVRLVETAAQKEVETPGV